MTSEAGLHEAIENRFFVAIATDKYNDAAWEELEYVPAEVATVKGWLCAEELGWRRFTPTFDDLAHNPDEDAIRQLRAVARDRAWHENDAAVLFVTGHGQIGDGTHYTILRDTQMNMLAATALRTNDLIAWLADTPIRHLLVILDVCYAGALAGEIPRLEKGLRPDWLVLPSATRDQQAFTGQLTKAIAEFLRRLKTSVGEQYGTGPYIDIAHFVRDVDELLGDGQALIPLPVGRMAGPHICLPNPHARPDQTVGLQRARRDLALLQQDLETHWNPRARGVAGREDAGWLFTGRVTLMHELIAAAAGPPGVTIVTGGAGSGKSAALARLVTLSDERFLAEYAAEVASIPADLRPAPGSVDVAVLATGKLHTQVLLQICRAVGVSEPVTGQLEPTAEDWLRSWHGWLTERDRSVTIVVDAVDEATHPETLVRTILAQMDPDPAHPRVRLLVGVRSPSAAGVGEPDGVGLLDSVLRARGGRRIPVDEAPWWADVDLIDYARNVLRYTPQSRYADAVDRVANLAPALAEHAGRSFLVARIAAASLAAVASDSEEATWLKAVDDGIVGVFRQDLHTSLPEAVERRRAVILLRAVAFARGSGLPWRKIWPLMAHAVDDEGGSYGDGEIADLLKSRLGGYLITDRVDDTTVYRLFHDLLRDTLRERWRDLLVSPTDVPART